MAGFSGLHRRSPGLHRPQAHNDGRRYRVGLLFRGSRCGSRTGAATDAVPVPNDLRMNDNQVHPAVSWLGRLSLQLVLSVVAWTCVFSLPVYAQELSLRQFDHRAWTSRDGAPINAPTIAQTKDGWLWFGTPTGLYRFDGVQFEQIEIEGLDPRRSRGILTLDALNSGGLAIGYAFGGVSLLKDGRFIHFTEKQGLPAGTVFRVVDDKRGGIWAACPTGIFRYDGLKWAAVSSDWGFPDHYGRDVFVDRSDTLWIAGKHEIFLLKPQSQRFEPTGTHLDEGTDGGEFLEAPDGRTWFMDSAGIHSLPAQPLMAPSAATTNPSTSNNHLIDSTNNYWSVDGKAVKRLPFDPLRHDLLTSDHLDADVDSFGAKDGLSEGLAKTLLEDREGNVWVSTWSGVDRFRPANLHTLPPPASEMGGKLMAASNSGAIWIGAGMGGFTKSALDGLWKFDGNFKRIAGTGVDRGFTAATVDTKGSAWFGGPSGIWRQEGQDDFRKFADVPEGSRGQDVYSMAVDVNGDPWVSMVRSTVFRYRNGVWEHNANRTDLPDGRATSLERDKDGRIWIGYSDGKLAVIDANQAKLFGAADGLDLGRITVVHAGAHVIVAGANRIAVFDDGRFHEVGTPVDPAVLEGVAGILEARNGDLWLVCFKGAVRIGAAELDQAIRNRTYQLPFEVFDAEDGFPGTIPQRRTTANLVEGTDGRLWFVGNQNIAWLNPANIRRNSIPPPIMFRSVSAGGRKYLPMDSLSLTAGTRDLQIDYTALSLSRPDRIRFRYRLDGFDESWVDAGSRRQAFYTNLAPGRYKFRVAAANESGVWNEQGASLDVLIAPTFVQTRAFLFLCVTVFVLLLWLAYSLRIRQLAAQMHARLDERLAERERIARELHDTFLQGVQGLMLRFQSAMEKIPTSQPARELMESALDHADAVIAEGRDRVSQLRTTQQTTSDLPSALQVLGENLMGGAHERFELTVEGARRPLDPVVSDEIQSIAREALVNAMRHAQAKQIDVTVTYGRSTLTVGIVDDGTGFDAETMTKQGPSGHWGLKGMQERAAKLHARLEISSRPRAGTAVELVVPDAVAFPQAAHDWKRRLGPLGAALGIRTAAARHLSEDQGSE